MNTLQSQVLSTETLVAGLGLVDQGAGMDELNVHSDESLAAELEMLEEGWWVWVSSDLRSPSLLFIVSVGV